MLWVSEFSFQHPVNNSLLASADSWVSTSKTQHIDLRFGEKQAYWLIASSITLVKSLTAFLCSFCYYRQKKVFNYFLLQHPTIETSHVLKTDRCKISKARREKAEKQFVRCFHSCVIYGKPSKTSHVRRTMREGKSFFFTKNLNDYLSFGKALKKFYHYFPVKGYGKTCQTRKNF